MGMELGSNETIKQAVMAGLGMALISAHAIAARSKTEGSPASMWKNCQSFAAGS